MQDVKQAQKAHVLVVPYPGQGHINPMLQFSKRLASKGIKPTLTPTFYMVKSMRLNDIPTQTGLPIQIRPISDGFDDGGKNQAGSTSTYLDSLNIHGPKTLAQLIKKLAEDGDPVKAVIYDGFLPWALDVGKKFGLIGVCFFTQSCTVNSVYYHVQRGLIQLPLSGQDTVSIPGAPELQPRDLPSFVEKYGSYPFWFRVVVEQFSNIDQADWVLCNIFYDMEKEIVDWMSTMWKIRTIGPTTPSHYLDKRLKDDKDYNLQLFKPNIELTKKWLDTKPTNSVIYISFGSAAILSELQFKELSQGLINSKRSFLWVVRELEHSKLPKGFLEETSNQGLVVSWASQLEILAHKATCCFVTHCGFNSILEALSLGVVVVGYPQYTDQGTNAKFVEDVWGVGIRAKVDEEGVVRREQVEDFIREVMEGKKRDEMMKNVSKWKKLAKEAMEEGGSSCKNIDEFVAYLGGC
ncbi:unnamed protein product [Amaranthus hypochondriacus]